VSSQSRSTEFTSIAEIARSDQSTPEQLRTFRLGRLVKRLEWGLRLYWITHGDEYSEALPILYDCLAPEFVVLPSNERLEIRRIISEQISVVRQAASREDIQEAQSYSRHQYANSDQGNDAEFEFNQDALPPFVLSAIRTIYDTIRSHLQDDLHGLFDMGVLAEQGI